MTDQWDDAAASKNSATPAAAATAGPTLADEIAFICGVAADGTLAATSFHTWTGTSSAQYSTQSSASKWGGSTAGTSGGTLGYYFDSASKWTATEKAAFVAGLDMWSAVADVSFTEVTSKADADLTFQRGSDGSAYESSSTYEHAVGTSTLSNPAPGSYISIDTSTNGFGTLGSFSHEGGYGIEVVLHEEGHFLGLGHAGPYNGNVKSATQQFSAYDNRMYSIMSYIDPSDTSGKYAAQTPVKGTQWNGHYATTWMPLDILAIQQLYGVATTTPLSGGQVFGYNTNITGSLQQYFDFTQNTAPVVTLWDKGADNTLDLSGCTTACTVNLNAGTYSSFDGMTNNLAIAYGTLIDHAIGGAANDRIMGNVAADTIEGGAGNDTIILRKTPGLVDGGTGTNTLIVGYDRTVALTDASFENFARVAVQRGGSVDLSGVTDAPASIVSQSVAGAGVTIAGSRGDDRITAGAGADTFDEMMAGFGRDTILRADLGADTFDLSTSFAADATAAHLHFAALAGGANTLVYGDAGQGADALILKGVTVATAEAHRDAFHVGGAGA